MRKIVTWIVYYFIKITAVPGFLLFRPKILFPESEKKVRIRGGALLISNHIGSLDPLYMMLTVWYRNHHFICMKEFYLNKFRGFLFDCFQCIPIDRENTGTESIREIAAHLKKGELVSMFPEGHVNKKSADGSLQKLKSGMVLMAMMSGKPIVPMYIKKRKHFLSRLHAAVGEPVDVNRVFGHRPNFSEIGKIVKLLEEKEELLRKAVEA